MIARSLMSLSLCLVLTFLNAAPCVAWRGDDFPRVNWTENTSPVGEIPDDANVELHIDDAFGQGASTSVTDIEDPVAFFPWISTSQEHAILDVELAPPSPATLLPSTPITATIRYRTTEPSIAVYGRGLYQGRKMEAWAYRPAWAPGGQGTVECALTALVDEGDFDQIQIRMFTNGWERELTEVTLRVDYRFRETKNIRVYDRQQGQSALVSETMAGQPGQRGSSQSAISANGRLIAYRSWSSDLLPGDTNNTSDIFLYDRQTGQTTRVSVSSTGQQGNRPSRAPAISGDGRYVAFDSYATNLVAGDVNDAPDVFVHDCQTGATTLISRNSWGEVGNGWSSAPTISFDGRYVAFYSSASNLVPNDTNEAGDIFVRDRQTGETTRVSVNSAGQEGNEYSRDPTISADGRHVAFESRATNLVPGDANDKDDIFAHDRQTGRTTRVSVSSAGQEGKGTSYLPTLSTYGRYVAFWSSANNLVADDTNARSDAFVHDRQTGETMRVSVSSAGNEGNGDSYAPAISGDGRYVAFASAASNLVAADTNDKIDVFLHNRETGQTGRVSFGPLGQQLYEDSHEPSISREGLYVAYTSRPDQIWPSVGP